MRTSFGLTSVLASFWSTQADRQISACAAAKLDIQKAHSEDLGTVTKGGPVRRALSASPKQLDSSTRALRVLVAEDNLVNQKVLQKVLQRVTPESPIFIANNGQEALQVPIHPPCVVASSWVFHVQRTLHLPNFCIPVHGRC